MESTALSYDNTVTLTQERFEFPLPDAEKEYGWTASHDATRLITLYNPLNKQQR